MAENISGRGAAGTKKQDGRASPGETLYLDIRIQNTGTENLYGLRAELSSDDRRIGNQIFLDRNRVIVGDLATGASATLTAGRPASPTFVSSEPRLLQPDGLNRAFRFSLDERCSDAPILFKITFMDSRDREWTNTLTVPVNPPEGNYSKTIGKFSFYITNKIMDDGSVQDGGLGMDYTGSFLGELRVRRTKTEKNEEFEGVDDSLNAANREIYEVFLLPVKYDFLRTSPAGRLWLGVGGYYYDETLKEKGFFNMPELEYLGMERVNSYTNDFSLRVLGPILDAGFTFRGSEWFKVSLSVGVVPLFATWAKQSVSIVPLLDPDHADYSQSHAGSPYLYADLSGTISLPDFRALVRKQGATPSDWKLWFSLLYDYSRLQYEILDFEFDGSGFIWHTPERTVVSGSFKLEGALLIPLGGMHLQIGGGHVFDSMTVDSGSAIRREKNYLNISGKLINF